MKKNIILGLKIVICIGLFRMFNQLSMNTGVPGVQLSLAYPLLAAAASVLGPGWGALIGFAGQLFTDLNSSDGTLYWIWIAAAGLFGLIIGFVHEKTKNLEWEFGGKGALIFQIFQIPANIFCWGIFAGSLDYMIMKETPDKVLIQCITTILCNIILVMVFGSVFRSIYARHVKRSLKRAAQNEQQGTAG